MEWFFYVVFSMACAYIYGGLSEWVLHKYFLHGLGKNKKSIFSFHWHAHHKACKRNRNKDIAYRSLGSRCVKYEIGFLFLLAVIHFPLFFLVPYFYIGIVLYKIKYFFVHRRAHLNTKWGKKNIPWHYDHHMGKDQDANYGVTVEWPDKLFNTRKK